MESLFNLDPEKAFHKWKCHSGNALGIEKYGKLTSKSEGQLCTFGFSKV